MKVLIVEDQEKLALSIKKGLEGESFTVETIFDGEEAFRHIEDNHKRYDVLVLDILLPGMNGIEICTKLRKKNINMPIIMLTALDTTDDRVQGLDAGADDYLIKPFAFKELLARIRALLRRPQIVVPEALALGGIVLDTRKRTVMRNKKEISLTVKEFTILEYMMQHPNQVLTREQIMGHVWDYSFDSFSNVVDVHIKNLRKKIQKKNETIFKTIHGVGYQFAV